MGVCAEASASSVAHQPVSSEPVDPVVYYHYGGPYLVIRTCDKLKNLYIPLILLTIFGS